MDIATILGLVGAFGLIVMAIDDMSAFIDTSSILIVIGGSIMVVMLRSSLGEFLGAVGVLAKTFKNKLDAPETLIEQIVELATIARKDGIIALESQEISNPFMATAIRMLVDGAQPHVVKQTLSSELVSMKLRHKHGISVIAYMGEVAPAMGMVGTLVGLVALLANMADVATLGANMSVAVLTTLYGAFLANAVFLPIANKLGVQSDLESLNREIIIQGVQFIQAGGNPRVLEDQLNAYVAPRARNTVTA